MSEPSRVAPMAWMAPNADAAVPATCPRFVVERAPSVASAQVNMAIIAVIRTKNSQKGNISRDSLTTRSPPDATKQQRMAEGMTVLADHDRSLAPKGIPPLGDGTGWATDSAWNKTRIGGKSFVGAHIDYTR